MRNTSIRKPKYRSPDQQIKDQDERRLEVRGFAEMQSIATGEDEGDILESLVVQEAAERGRGDAEKGLYIFDAEMARIKQDQSRDALEQLIAIVREAGESYRADPDNYITAEQAETVT